MSRELAFELLTIALYVNSVSKQPKTSRGIVYDVSRYIDSNYQHDFYTETDNRGVFFPFLYDWIKEGN